MTLLDPHFFFVLFSFERAVTEGGVTGITQVSKIFTHNPTGRNAQDSFLDRYNAFTVQQRNIIISKSFTKVIYFHLIELRLDVPSCYRTIKCLWPLGATANHGVAPLMLLKCCS